MAAASPLQLHEVWPDEPRVSRVLVLVLMAWAALLQVALQSGYSVTPSTLATTAPGLADPSVGGRVFYDPHLAGFVPPLAPWLAAHLLRGFGFHPGLLYLATLGIALGTLLVVHDLVLAWHGPYRALQASLLLLASPLFYFSLLKGFALHLSLFLVVACGWAWIRHQEEGRATWAMLYYVILAAAVLTGGAVNAGLILAIRLTKPAGLRFGPTRDAAPLATTVFTLVLFLVGWPLLSWAPHRGDLVLHRSLFSPWLFGYDPDGFPVRAHQTAWLWLLGLLPWGPIALCSRACNPAFNVTRWWRRAWLTASLWFLLWPGSPVRLVLLTPVLVLLVAGILAEEERGKEAVRPGVMVALLAALWAIAPILNLTGWIQYGWTGTPLLLGVTLIVGLSQILPDLQSHARSRWLMPMAMLLLTLYALTRKVWP